MTDPSEVYSRAQDYIDFNDSKDDIQDALEEWMYHGESGSHKVKWGKNRQGKQRYKIIKAGEVGIGGKAYREGKGRRIIEKVVEPLKIRDKIDTIDRIKSTKGLDKKKIEFNKRFKSIDSTMQTTKLYEDIKGKYNDKVQEKQQEVLIKEGKTTTFYRNQIKSANSISDVNSILSDARNTLEPGKNLDFIEFASQTRKEELNK